MTAAELRSIDRPGGPAATYSTEIVSWSGNEQQTRWDTLAVEEPLEIIIEWLSVAVTMRTPGDDFDLALGFLLTEGIIRSQGDVVSIAHCPAEDEASSFNVVNVNPSDPALVDPDRWRRNFYATSSCGVCGKASIETVRQDTRPIESDAHMPAEMLYRLGEELRSAQTVFGQTGGLHAAALFDLQGHLVTLREDVGRHNAVDKVVGDAFRRGMAGDGLRDHVLMVSGRTSFEIVQKALMAGIPIVIAVSAPSSLAVELARSSNMTLVGFLRQGRFNVYAGGERIAGSHTAAASLAWASGEEASEGVVNG